MEMIDTAKVQKAENKNTLECVWLILNTVIMR